MTYATPAPVPVAEAARLFAAASVCVIPIHRPIPGAGCTCGRPQCQDTGKHPALAEWRTYIQRRPLPEELELWFGQEERNIAVICGQVSDGLTVIDCDDHATYQALLYAYRDLRDTLTVRTGKGYHLYCYSPGELRTVSFVANGLKHHVKAEGGYVVAPPSLHRSGNAYAWVNVDAPPIILDLDRLAAALRRIGAAKTDPSTQAVRHEPGWAAKLLTEGARYGSRDEDCIRLAGYLKRLVPYADALAILDLWAARCDQRPGDPWGMAQVQAKLDSAFRYD